MFLASRHLNKVFPKRLPSHRWVLVMAIPALLVAFSASAETTPPSHKGMRHRLASCATCHGKYGQGNLGDNGGGGVYPRLAGQPTHYLYEQLLRFKAARRTGIPPVDTMQQLLSSLPPSYLKLIAQYYSHSSPPYPPRAPRNKKRWQAGRELVLHGVPDKNVASCTSCHGANLEGHAPDVPSIAGQYARYIMIQFDHWSQGARHSAVHEHIAQVLTMPQIEAVAHYLASLRPADAAGGDQ